MVVDFTLMQLMLNFQIQTLQILQQTMVVQYTGYALAVMHMESIFQTTLLKMVEHYMQHPNQEIQKAQISLT